MSEIETRYARAGDMNVAYQVIGDGPINVVVVPGMISHVEFSWELPGYAQLLKGLARWARVAVFDKRGNGLSDAVAQVPGVDERMDDIRAVMDAVGMQHAALFGVSEGAALGLLFAATFPAGVDQVAGLGGFAYMYATEGYPYGFDPEEFDYPGFVDELTELWGSGVSIDVCAPSVADDPQARAQWARLERLSSTPGAVGAQFEMAHHLDVRAVLPSVRVPVLMLHAENDPLPAGSSQYVAEQVRDGRVVELGGYDHYPWFNDTTELAGQLEEFFTGSRTSADVERVLTTVLFTDIVDSTKHATELGDRRWRELLDRFRERTRRELDRYRGREINTRGDDFLATFDGPARGTRCASAIASAARSLGVEVRAGLHTGEVELQGDDIAGLAVHIGARICALAGNGEVLVSSTVKDLVVGSELNFEERGTHTLKGVPDTWRIYALNN